MGICFDIGMFLKNVRYGSKLVGRVLVFKYGREGFFELYYNSV